MQLPRYIRENDDDDDIDLEAMFNDSIYEDFIVEAARQFGFEAKAPSNGKRAFICSNIQLAKPLSHTNGFTYTHARVTAGTLDKDNGVWVRVKARRFSESEGRVLKPGRYRSICCQPAENMGALSAFFDSLLPRLQKSRFSTVRGLHKALEALGYWTPKK